MNETNPYEPPRDVVLPVSLDPATVAVTPEDVSVFVGRNAQYYLKRWAGALQGFDSGTGFNWAAFFLSGLWLPYRKMYGITAAFFGFIFFETILEEVVFVQALGRPEAPAALGRIVGLVASIVCGGWGNTWYLSRMSRVVAELRSQELPADAYSEALAKRGGTNIAASLGFFVLFIAAFFAFELFFVGD